MSELSSAHRNGANGFLNIEEKLIDANGDLIKNDSGSRLENSSDEEVASCSSKDEETEEVIQIKTR